MLGVTKPLGGVSVGGLGSLSCVGTRCGERVCSGPRNDPGPPRGVSLGGNR